MLSCRGLGFDPQLSSGFEQSGHKFGFEQKCFSRTIAPAQQMQIRGCIGCMCAVFLS